VDSLTHGLLAFYLLSALGLPGIFLLPVIIGAVLPDIDILFRRFSDRNPRYFIFTHGGFTHSITGVVVMAALLTTTAGLMDLLGLPVPQLGYTLFFAFLAGSLVHVILDLLAYPGIPVLYPFSPRKYTLGIFPGPSLFLFAVTVGFLALVLAGIQSLASPAIYLVIVVGCIAFRTVMKAGVALTKRGITVPRINPFDWLIIRESDGAYTLESYRAMGSTTPLDLFPKYQHTTSEEIAPLLNRPEVQRHRYYSYISVAMRRDDGTVVFLDPLRKGKYVWYPPEYVSIEVPIQE
jgi:inner membrane protein